MYFFNEIEAGEAELPVLIRNSVMLQLSWYQYLLLDILTLASILLVLILYNLYQTNHLIL
jgi:hypothetical protein